MYVSTDNKTDFISRNKKLLLAILSLTVVCLLLIKAFIANDIVFASKDSVFKSIMNDSYKYSSYKTFYCDIYYTEQDKDYVETVANCIDFYAPLIYNDFGLTKIPDVKIIIFKNSDEMAKTLGLKYSTNPMGVYYGGMLNLISPSEWIKSGTETYIKERFVKEGPIIHELVHLVTDIKTEGNYSIWLTEGISLYYENKYATFEWRQDLKLSSAYITIDELSQNFRKLDEAKAYRRSFDIINNYINKNGEGKFQEQLTNISYGEKEENIFN